MRLKNLFLFGIVVLLAFSIQAMANRGVSGPLELPLAVSPAIIGSDDEGVMDMSSLLLDVPYQVTCTVETNSSDDPIYVIFNFNNYDSGDPILVDGQPSANLNEAFITTPGMHTVSFNANSYNPSGEPENTTFHNASSDVISMTNCFAVLN